MKIEEVPQDNRFLEKTNLRDIYYAQDNEGNYRQVASVGWAVKNEALSLTWESISDRAEAVRLEALAGKKSPLAYHMEMRLLDTGLLASYSGFSRKTIRKHLIPQEFERLDDRTLQKYAEVLNITVDELKRI